jgi:hypothetical protein
MPEVQPPPEMAFVPANIQRAVRNLVQDRTG